MSKFLACLKNESRKLLYRKKYIVFLGIGMLLSLLCVLGKIFIMRLSGGSLSFSGSNTAMVMLSLFADFYLPLISIMAVCDLFSSEFQDSTIKAMLLRPVSRLKIYIGKIAAVCLLAFCYFIAGFIVSTLFDLLLLGEVKALHTTLFAYILDFFPMVVVILMATFINQIGKGSTISMFLCIMGYILLYVVGIFVPNLSGLLFTGYMEWHTLWLGYTLPFDALLAKVALLVGYGAVFGSGGYYFFLKREA